MHHITLLIYIYIFFLREKLDKRQESTAIPYMYILKLCTQSGKLFPGSVIQKPSGKGTDKAHTHNAQDNRAHMKNICTCESCTTSSEIII